MGIIPGTVRSRKRRPQLACLSDTENRVNCAVHLRRPQAEVEIGLQLAVLSIKQRIGQNG